MVLVVELRQLAAVLAVALLLRARGELLVRLLEETTVRAAQARLDQVVLWVDQSPEEQALQVLLESLT